MTLTFTLQRMIVKLSKKVMLLTWCFSFFGFGFKSLQDSSNKQALYIGYKESCGGYQQALISSMLMKFL